jgi:hypothetical protein
MDDAAELCDTEPDELPGTPQYMRATAGAYQARPGPRAPPGPPWSLDRGTASWRRAPQESSVGDRLEGGDDARGGGVGGDRPERASTFALEARELQAFSNRDWGWWRRGSGEMEGACEATPAGQMPAGRMTSGDGAAAA